MIAAAISSAILWQNIDSEGGNGTDSGGDDDWYLTDEEIARYCGINDCPWNNISNPIAQTPEQEKVRLTDRVVIGEWNRT